MGSSSNFFRCCITLFGGTQAKFICDETLTAPCKATHAQSIRTTISCCLQGQYALFVSKDEAYLCTDTTFGSWFSRSAFVSMLGQVVGHPTLCKCKHVRHSRVRWSSDSTANNCQKTLSVASAGAHALVRSHAEHINVTTGPMLIGTHMQCLQLTLRPLCAFWHVGNGCQC